MASDERDPAGFYTECGARLPDGLVCQRMMWVSWIASERRGKHFETDQRTPHKHREVASWPATCPETLIPADP